MTNEELEARVDALEEIVVMLASQNTGGSTAGFSELRALNRVTLAKIGEDVRDRVRDKLDEATERLQFTGLNIPEVRAFVGGAGTVVEEGLDVYLIHNGTSDLLRRGAWVVRDPIGGHVYLGR